MEKWIKDLTPDMLPSPYNEYLEVLGAENLYLLSKTYGGTRLYIPKLDSLLKEPKIKMIKQEYNGYNIQKLALKYGLCERTIRYIVSSNNTIPGQISLFE